MPRLRVSGFSSAVVEEAVSASSASALLSSDRIKVIANNADSTEEEFETIVEPSEDNLDAVEVAVEDKATKRYLEFKRVLQLAENGPKSMEMYAAHEMSPFINAFFDFKVLSISSCSFAEIQQSLKMMALSVASAACACADGVHTMERIFENSFWATKFKVILDRCFRSRGANVAKLMVMKISNFDFDAIECSNDHFQEEDKCILSILYGSLYLTSKFTSFGEIWQNECVADALLHQLCVFMKPFVEQGYNVGQLLLSEKVVQLVLNIIYNCCQSIQNRQVMNEQGVDGLTITEFLVFIRKSIKEKIKGGVIGQVVSTANAVYANARRRMSHLSTILDYKESTDPFKDAYKDQMFVILALAYLVDRGNVDIIMNDRDQIEKIIQYARQALSRSEHQFDGFTLLELIRAIERVAFPARSKPEMVSFGGLSLLAKVLESNVSPEVNLATLYAILQVALETKNKHVMSSKKHLLNALKALKDQSPSAIDVHQRIVRAAEDILWILETQDKRLEGLSDVFEKAGAQVVVSYENSSFDIMRKISDRLRQSGFEVWMDETRYGSSLVEIAAAIEEAQVVLVCVTRRYRESGHCQIETNYAHEQKKKLIPLFVEKNYSGDDWLEDKCRSAQGFRFDSPDLFEDNFDGLCQRIKQSYLPPSERAASESEEEIPPCDWGNHLVQQWLKSISFDSKGASKRETDRLTGKHLLALQKLRVECPAVFYNMVSKDLGLNSITALLDFTTALEELALRSNSMSKVDRKEIPDP